MHITRIDRAGDATGQLITLIAPHSPAAPDDPPSGNTGEEMLNVSCAALSNTELPADEQETAQLWSDYSGRWTQWNTARAAFNTIGLLLVGLALYVWGRQG